MRYQTLIAILVIAGIFFVSCSSSPVTPATPNVSMSNVSDSSTALWGLYEAYVDMDSSTIDFIRNRTAEVEVNVVKFLQDPSLGPKISVSNFQVSGSVLDVDVKITHPFPGKPEYMGFFVRGVVLTKGTMSGFQNPKLVMSSPVELRLKNADGYTRWMNPKEFPYNGKIFNYWPGHLGDPYGNLYTSTVNPYKVFADGLSANPDNLNINEANGAVFSAGNNVTRHYTLDFGSQPKTTFQYAVVVSTDQPTVNPPSGINDFPAGTVASEPWYVGHDIHSTLNYESGNLTGTLIIDVQVKDFENPSQVKVFIESPGHFPRQEASFTSQQGSAYIYILDVQNLSFSAAGTYDALIAAVATDNAGYDGRLPGEETATYQLIQYDVSGDPPPPPDWIFYDDFVNYPHIWTAHGGDFWGKANGYMDAKGGGTCYENNDGSDAENPNVSYVSSPPIDIPPSTKDLVITFNHTISVDPVETWGSFAWDMCYVRLDGTQIFPTGGPMYENNYYPWTFDPIYCWTDQYPMTESVFNLGTAYNGTTIELEFVLDTYDNILNCDPPFFGWLIDDVLIEFAD